MLTASQKQQWVSALRSGRYWQLHGGWMAPNGSRCPNAVLIAEVTGIEQSFTDLYTAAENLIGATWVMDIMVLNDRERLPFAEIADYIETNLPTIPEPESVPKPEPLSFREWLDTKVDLTPLPESAFEPVLVTVEIQRAYDAYTA